MNFVLGSKFLLKQWPRTTLFSSDGSQRNDEFVIWRERKRDSLSDLAIHISALAQQVTQGNDRLIQNQNIKCVQ